jgi:hypothetical protein
VEVRTHSFVAPSGGLDILRLLVVHAFELAGPGIVSDTLTIALGFGVLLASRVPANARLGMVMVVALLGCCALTLVGLGAALSAREPVPVPVPRTAAARAARTRDGLDPHRG